MSNGRYLMRYTREFTLYNLIVIDYCKLYDEDSTTLNYYYYGNDSK